LKSELTPAERAYLNWVSNEDVAETVMRPAQTFLAGWYLGYQVGLVDGSAGVLPRVEKPTSTFEEFMRATEPVNKERKTLKVKRQADHVTHEIGDS